MSMSINVTATLRAQEHGHQPVVLVLLSHDREARQEALPTQKMLLRRSEGR